MPQYRRCQKCRELLYSADNSLKVWICPRCKTVVSAENVCNQNWESQEQDEEVRRKSCANSERRTI